MKAPARFGRMSSLVISVMCVGCHALAPGDVGVLRPVSSGARAGNVCLIRGWRDLYSAGIDRLADDLRERGVAAHVFRDEQWPDLADALKSQYAINTDHDPLILIGFSYGADDALRVADELQKRGLAVDLLVTIDPVTPPAVPANVVTCLNFYETHSFWDVFPWLRGVPLKAVGIGRLVNVDIRRTRRDLLEPNTAHSNIAANPKLRLEIIARVVEACPPRRAR
jgi:pimeloyl-ACP methyl ester carboxylesterase